MNEASGSVHTSLQKQLKKLTKCLAHPEDDITKEHTSENYLCKNFESKQGRAFAQEGGIFHFSYITHKM